MLSVVLVGFSFLYPHVVRCVFVGFSDYRKIDSHIYLANTIESQQDQAILSMLEDARIRLASHFGVPEAKPKIIVVANETQAQRLGLGGAAGTVLIAPWGNYLLLHIDKANIDVVAHELVHAEIAHRLGYYDRITKIPTWLDEGIALQVDYRKEYTPPESIEDEELERVTALVSPNDFWTNDRDLTYQNYLSSKVAVNMTLFKRSTQGSLYSVLKKINAGEELDNLIRSEGGFIPGMPFK